MKKSKKNPKVDEFIGKSNKWKKEYGQLRSIVLDCGLTEEFKWMHPCYTLENKNILLIHGFKEYCAVLFHKGALLKDSQGILIQQTENVQAASQIRFTNMEGIIEMDAILKEYIKEAIEVEQAGLEVNLKKHTEFIIPDELQDKFEEIAGLKSAFEALTPGRQRAYILYFSEAKQSKTRTARVEKYTKKILDGKGLKD
ncbi:YdeI family protein [Psychrobacillus sp. NEAU-3TGS]|uniref:YdeI/OmpD-associated family protein n=1 Tax=Psychrobacillus sp. NEAU-3TGS TaxID=2995412 RepID=UPI002497604B|nr:YdeI family protein [Psychrobacillus sp. NEAU-3TGS]MDI2588494.1 YdeI family protein [Psychrobacillus sp. NEAU-3TGS]